MPIHHGMSRKNGAAWKAYLSAFGGFSGEEVNLRITKSLKFYQNDSFAKLYFF